MRGFGKLGGGCGRRSYLASSSSFRARHLATLATPSRILHRRLLELSWLVLLVLVLSTGCTNPATSVTSAGTGPVTATNPAPTDLPYRTDSTLTLSSVPKLGETVDLTFTIKVVRSDDRYQPSAGLARSKAWVDFYWTNTKGSYSEAYSSVQIPAEQAIVSGEFPWNGSYQGGLTLHGKIKPPREGIWNIVGNFKGEGWLAGAGAEIRLAVADGAAAIMGTEDFKTGPLAYLGNLTYEGGVSPPVFSPDPVSLGLDISKAPRPGEEVTLSCRIASAIDVPDLSIQWYFLRRLGDNTQEIPAAELVSSVDLSWKTDVKKGEAVVFSTTIKFPTEGDWEVAAAAKSGTRILSSSEHRMRISITSTRSYFGWVERSAPRITIPETGTTTIPARP